MSTESAMESASSSSPAPTRRVDRFLLLAFFVSGVTGLIFETVWTRILVVVFGATALAVASVLAAYMAGLGLGGVLGGRWAERVKRPLLAYGCLEGVIAIYGLLVPRLVPALTPVYRVIFQRYSPHFLTFSVIRVAMVFAVLVVPTTLMGATLPLLSRWIEGRARADLGASRLYAMNTAGAVLGTILAGFELLPRLGTAATNTAAVVTGVVLALLVIGLGRGVGAAPPAATTDAPSVRLPARQVLILAAFGLSGAASMIDEVAWTRGLVMGLGPSTYAFSVMLAAFLIGISLGGALGVRIAARVQQPWLWFGVVEALAGGLTLGAIHGFEPMLWVYRALSGAGPGGRGPLALGAKALASGTLLIPTALCLGAAFPLAAAAYSADDRRLAVRVGELYGANTLGCILGSLVAGFALVPRLGIESALVVAAGLNLAVGVALFLTARGLRPALRLAGAGAFAILGASMVLRPPRWDPTFLATNSWVGGATGSQTLLLEPGYTATVSVTLQASPPPARLSLRTDGKADGSDVGDLSTQVQLALVPLLFHPDPRAVLVVGLGTGTTCGSVLRDPRVQSLDVLEIERGMVDGSRWFEHMNGRPLDDPRTHLIEIDARNYYRASDRRYDVIISEPSNPWMAGPSHLFTREAFQEAHGLLRPGGIFGQWVQGYRLSPDALGSVLRAMAEAFPYYRIVQIPRENDLLLLASDQPLPLDLGLLRARSAPLQSELARGRIFDGWDLLAELVGDERSVAPLTAGYLTNTDDRNVVEFRAPLDQGGDHAPIEWLASGYAGPYAELAAQGVSADEIGGRVGFRIAEDIGPQLEPSLVAFLQQRGDPVQASLVEALWRWQAATAAPQTEWQLLLERERRWQMGLPQPAATADVATGREGRFAQLVRGGAPVEDYDPLDDLVGLVASSNASAGQCAAVRRLAAERFDLATTRTEFVLAFTSAQDQGVAEALVRCGQPAEAELWHEAAVSARRRLGASFLDREPADFAAALMADPLNLSALRLQARARCLAGDRPGELAALTELVEREQMWSIAAARLAFLVAGRPPDDPVATLLARLERLRSPGSPRALASCPEIHR